MITRYAMRWATDEDEFVYVSPIESDKGNWVKLEDYARLKADKDVLDNMLIGERLHCSLLADKWSKGEIARLKAEVERLRASSFVTAVPVEQYERVVKAGDDLVEALKDMDAITDMDSNHPEVAAWNAAKEGKPSV